MSSRADQLSNTTGWDYSYVRKVWGVGPPQVAIADSGSLSPYRSHGALQTTTVPWFAIGEGGSLGSPGYYYPPSYNRQRITNARGFHTYVYVDKFFAADSIVEPLAGRFTKLARDSLSQVTSVRDVRGNVTTLTYDTLGNVHTMSNATTGRIDSVSYEVTTIDGLAVTVGPLNITNNIQAPRQSFRYSGVRVAQSWLFPDSTIPTRYYLRSDGRPDSITDPGGHTTRFKYAAAGRQNLDTIRGPVAYAVHTYDSYGRIARTRMSGRDSMRYAYDARNRTIKTHDPAGDSTVYVYDARDLTQVIDALGKTYTFAYNAVGWDTSYADPAGNTQRYEYDLNGNVARWTNRRSQITAFVYDSLDRVTRRTADTAVTTYTTDARDTLQVMSNSASTDSLYRDRDGRPVRAVTLRGGRKITVRTTYDPDNGTVSGVYVDTGAINTQVGSQLTSVDSLGRLASITDQGGLTTTFGYNADRLPDLTRYSTTSNVDLVYDYTSGHAESSLFYSQPGVTVVAGRYIKLDSVGRVREWWKSSATDTFRIFTYDAAGRLVLATSNAASAPAGSCTDSSGFGFDCPTADTLELRAFVYTYDRAGNSNADSVKAGNRPRFVTLDFRNPVSGNPWMVDTLTYDADGNLTERKSRLVRQTFHWNALSQLDSVLTYNSGTLQNTGGYRYDGSGRRVWKGHLADTVGFVWDGDGSVAETNSTNQIAALYSYTPGSLTPFSMTRSGSTYYYLLDEASNVTALMKHDGTITNTYSYWPFGWDTISNNVVHNQYRFAGQYSDETGLYYMRNRYYDHRTRRFISEDPIGLAGGINMYAYAGNDPINSSDPMGLQERRRCLRHHPAPPDESTFIVGSGQAIEATILCDEWGVVDLASAFSSRFGQRNWGTFFENIGAGMGAWGSTDRVNTGPGYNTGLILGAASLFITGGRFQIGIRSGHGARHLIGTGLNAAEVEAAILAQVGRDVTRASAVGSEFWGTVTVRGYDVTFRANQYAPGRINIGTYYIRGRIY